MPSKKSLSSIQKLISYYGDKPYVQSLMQIIPYWGVADSVLQQKVDEIRSERIRAFFDELAEGKQELDDEIIQQEDFLHCYFSTLRAALNTRRREKIKLFAKLLKSSTSKSTEGPIDEYEEILESLDSISYREFCLLYELKKLETSVQREKDENQLEHINRYWESFKSKAKNNYNVHPSILESYMAKIERTGLYLRITGGFYDYTGDRGHTTTLFNRLIDLIENQ